MVRCSRCGLRLRDAEPVCPLHGARPAEPVAPGSEEHPPASAEEEAKVVAALEGHGYRVDGLLGQGGFGTVHRATRIADGQRVAVKVALTEPRSAAATLEREAAALAQVGTPWAPAIYERGEAAGRTFIALEFIEAPTLADRLVAEAGPMPRDRFAAIALAILRSVEAIHDRGLVHRDLKPENIFLEGDTSVVARIIDFGLVRDLSAPAASADGEREEAMGTAEYMSPEQCEGLADDPRSDVYSLGVLLFEMLTGAPPFWGKPVDVRDAHRTRRPPGLPATVRRRSELEALLRKCLAKDRNRRPADLTALRAELELAIGARSSSGPPSIPPPPAASLAPAVTVTVPKAGLQLAPAAPREKRTMGLLFFESRAPLPAVQAAIAAAGGHLAHAGSPKYVVAFGHDAGDNPAWTAMTAAQRMLSAGLSDRILVDVAAVSVQARPGAPLRIFSTLFTKSDCYPTATDPAGVSLTAATADVIPDLLVAPLPDRADRFGLAQEDPDKQKTSDTATVGREELLKEMVDAARRATELSEPTLATIVGEPGHGKTHLVTALSRRIERDLSAFVIRAAAREGLVGAQSQTLPDLLRRLLDLPAETPEDGGRSLLSARLGEGLGEQAWAPVALSLGWIAADHPELLRVAAAPGALRLATARATGQAMRRRAAARPLALLLDDAHLADDATLDALEYATLGEARAPIFVFTTARPSFLRGRPTWGTRAAHGSVASLSPLEHTDAMELARRLLGIEGVPVAALTRLVDRTQGVPQLLVVLVRGLKRDGVVRRYERGTGYYLATDELDKLPDLPIVQWNARREVETLPAQLAGHARLASVLGARFTIAEVEGLIERLEAVDPLEDVQLDAAVGVQRLIESRLLAVQPAGLIDFRNPLVRDTIYDLLPDQRRRLFHRAAFEMYRAAEGMPEGQRLPRLALHAARSGAKDEAVAAYLKLAERDVLAQAYFEAERAFGGVLDNLAGPDDPRFVRAARGRGLMRVRLGRHEDALKDLEGARARAHDLGAVDDEVDLLLEEATALDLSRDNGGSAARLEAALALVKDPSPLTTARIAMARSRTCCRQLDFDGSVRIGVEAERLAESLGEPGYETMMISLLIVGPMCANMGRLDEAQVYIEKAVSAARARGDMLHLAAALNNRLYLWSALHNVEGLFEDLAATLRIGREVGDPVIEIDALQNRSEIEYVLERLDDAVTSGNRALELATRLWGDQSREASSRELLLARVALYRGDHDQLRGHLERIRARLASNAPGSEMETPDRMMFGMVELASRGGTPDEWSELLERVEATGLQPLEHVEIIEAGAIAAERSGRTEDARALLRKALDTCAATPNLMSGRVQRRYEQLTSR
jgi:tetratricopeptide (TPR) repeat protein